MKTNEKITHERGSSAARTAVDKQDRLSVRVSVQLCRDR
jgi:hypothetical protein